MKYLLCILVAILTIVSGCASNGIPDDPLPAYNEEETEAQTESNQQITETTVYLGEVLMNESEWLRTECQMLNTDGGPVQYSLQVTFQRTSTDQFNSISFSIMDSENIKENLLTKGSHPAFGGQINNRLQPHTYGLNVEANEMEIVWEMIETSGTTFSGEGFINIKKSIKKVCHEKMWVDGHYAYKGDSDYFCPIEEEYPPQRIPFSCQGATN